jgi:hypothetical protein
MNRSVKSLIGYHMQATDGEIGEVTEFYFDDLNWTVRYLIVRTGGWLFGRKVLISPQALVSAEWIKQVIPINLTTEQVRHSPDIDLDEPVSRQQEELLYRHYPWQGYWDGAYSANGVWGMLPDREVMTRVTAASDMLSGGDINLRSTRHVTGYRIHATDGAIGEVMDFLVDDANWALHYLVVKTGNWLKPDKVLLSTKWITAVNWADSTITIDISIDRAKRSYAYDERQYVDSQYE